MLLPTPVTILGTILLGRGAMAAALAAPAPLITPAAQLADRAVLSIIGYISTGTARGTVLCKQALDSCFAIVIFVTLISSKGTR